jgi:hypothetical protein
MVESTNTDQKINCKNGFPGITPPGSTFVTKKNFLISPNNASFVITIIMRAFENTQANTTLVLNVL